MKEIRYRKAVRLALLVMLSLLLLIFTVACDPADTLAPGSSSDGGAASSSAPDIIDPTACEHNFGAWTVTEPGTCQKPGKEVRVCTLCLQREERDLIVPHTYVDGVCSVCHTACTHNFGEWTVQTPASCTAPGLSQHTCQDCGAVETQPIPQEPHNYKDGVCTVCGQKEPKGSAGLAYQKNDDNGSYTVTGIGACTDKDLVIPAEYNGLPVTGIAPLAFMGAPITSATLPASLTDYGLTPFLNCASLTKITLAEGTTALTSCWLLSGTAVKEFIIPETVKTIAGGFFYNSSVTTLRYAGSTSQWETISKEAHWAEPLSTSTVICANGSVSTKN